MDIYKLISQILLLLTVYSSLEEVNAGKKHRHHQTYPIKPLFGVGVGYKKVVSYKPVLVFQKHKHVKLKRPLGWGWGWGGWGWKPHHHHGGHGHGKRGHSGWGHKHNIDHHHYHHNDGGWGGWGEEDGGYGGGHGWADDHDDYGGWESNLKANWSSPAQAPASDRDRIIPDQMAGYSGHGPSPPPPVEMARARGQVLTPDYHQHQQNWDKRLESGSEFTDRAKSQEIINQNPPPPLEHNPFGGYNKNYANFNMGHPVMANNQPQQMSLFAGNPRSVRQSLKKGVSVPLVGGGIGLPFYSQNFPSFQQFHGRGVVRPF